MYCVHGVLLLCDRSGSLPPAVHLVRHRKRGKDAEPFFYIFCSWTTSKHMDQPGRHEMPTTRAVMVFLTTLKGDKSMRTTRKRTTPLFPLLLAVSLAWWLSAALAQPAQGQGLV